MRRRDPPSTQSIAVCLRTLPGQQAEIRDDEGNAVVQAGFDPGERVGVSLDDDVELIDGVRIVPTTSAIMIVRRR